MELKGSQTEKNLKAALAGESIARNKYTYFATQARKEGLTELADMFERLSINECTHAKFWYTAVHGAMRPSAENLEIAAAGELEEWSRMYPSFAATAREEGFDDLAMMFERVAAIEKDHEKQFMEAIIRMKQAKQASSAAAQTPRQAKPQEAPKQEKMGYRCQFCGAVFEGDRPDVCPVCGAIGSFDPCTVLK